MYRTKLTLGFPAKNLYLVEMHQAKPVVPPRCRGIMLFSGQKVSPRLALYHLFYTDCFVLINASQSAMCILKNCVPL